MEMKDTKRISDRRETDKRRRRRNEEEKKKKKKKKKNTNSEGEARRAHRPKKVDDEDGKRRRTSTHAEKCSGRTNVGQVELTKTFARKRNPFIPFLRPIDVMNEQPFSWDFYVANRTFVPFVVHIFRIDGVPNFKISPFPGDLFPNPFPVSLDFNHDSLRKNKNKNLSQHLHDCTTRHYTVAVEDVRGYGG
jgi:hypothetical protein